ncbi:pre-peptidase C-terminal domain-containing protein [Pleionea sp. CnH1-48]|uniref:pre-peptidase C-terminal domain-containing protein n=1 Tax=Pleionea sp. CnH1-48 TaxID=2954494 RepID=UPI00273A7254|nr:pre-peptidase C-terminal domain-containing protein [Pleionea sp. CnH1-48]
MKYKKMMSSMLAVLAGLSLSAKASDTPLSASAQINLSDPQTITLSGFNNSQLRARDALVMANATQPVLRYAEPVSVNIKPNNDWQQVQLQAQGQAMSVWRTVVTSPGALSLNLGFSEYYMPAGGSLFIYTPDGKHKIRAFTAADNEKHGELWTPMLPGNKVVIEANVPTNKLKFLRLTLSSVNHGYLGEDLNSSFEQAQIMSGSCNVDVVCPEGDDWRKQIRSVAAISTGGSLFCTGSALNNTANDGRGFFLTANHCGINSSNASSLVTYWNYENSYCRTPGSTDSGSSGDGSLSDFNTGATFRASYSNSDFTLVELDDPFNASHQVYLSGWNANSALNTSAVAIHHPSVDEKRISFENDPVSRTNYSSSTPNANGTHVRVADWDLGTTEPGSSGSPLFDQNKRVIGQLHGGGAACGNNQSDWYGSLSVSWNGGGSNNSRASNWLDSAGTGQLAIDGMEATGGGGGQDPNAAFGFSCTDLNCSFDGSGSTDPDGTISSYAWNFGDGNTGSGVSPSHSFASAGSYTVTLTVTDNEGRTDSATQTVNVGSGGDGELSNGVPVTGLSGSTGDTQEFYMVVPADATNVEFTMSGGSGDADLYVKFGSKPTTSSYDCRPYTSGNNETCSFNAQAGTYYVMVRAYRSFSGVTLTGSYTTGGSGGTFEQTNLSDSQGGWKHYTVDIPAGMSTFTIDMDGGSGDADLYVRRGSQPTTGSYDCRPYRWGNTESCSFNNPAAGTWYISVRAYSSYSGANINAAWSP